LVTSKTPLAGKPLSRNLSVVLLAILVTGGTGFIGTRLVQRLVGDGRDVTALIRSGKSAATKSVIGDLTYPDFDFDESYEVVYHLASLWPGEKDRRLQKKVNFDGTVNLFSKLKDKARSFVYVSGLGVFGDTRDKVIDESTELRPNTEYAKIRLEAQKFLEENCLQYGIPFTVAYLGDVYGDGGWFKSMMVERLRRNSFRILGSGKYYRSFVHVDDVVSALVAIGEKNQTSQSFVITDSNPAMFSDFVDFTCSKLGLATPGAIPAFLAKAALGSDFVTLLTTSTRASNTKISGICNFKYKSYREGIGAALSEIQS